MSLEAALAENTASQIALAAAIAANSALLERVVAGQTAALEKIETPAAPKATRAKKKDDAPAETPPAAEPVEVSDVDINDAGKGWLGATSDAAERKSRGEFLMSITAHFGSPKLTGAESTLDAGQRRQTLFFINRKKAGLPVDFGADYDFDGDPAQSGGAAAAAEEDPFG